MTRFWTVPNLLSLSRLPLAAAVWIAPGNATALVALTATAAVTDVLDGWLARRAGAPPDIGAWLDPVCDKAFIVSALAAVWYAHRPPGLMMLAIATREILQAPFWLVLRFAPRFRGRRYDFRAAYVGKATTAAQMFAVAALVFRPEWAPAFALVSGLLGAAAVGVYVRRAVGSRG